MLKYSIFSQDYLNYRLDRKNPGPHEVQGTLAISREKHDDQPLVVRRSQARTWWETGWKLHNKR